jgi:quinol-cytochrome oxidoreductase complex cytochrome b subunit
VGSKLYRPPNPASFPIPLKLKNTNLTFLPPQFVFPNAGLTLAAIQVGSALNSPGINGICSALTIFLVIMWLITAVAHILALWNGKIMWPGKDEDKDMQNLGWGKFSA